jgi:hypothetical protein
VSGNFSTYTDLNAPTGFVYYMIEVINPNNCTPASGKSNGYGSSVSNIETNKTLGVEDKQLSANLLVYPNPATDKITIKSAVMINGKIVLSIANSMGIIIKSIELQSNDLSRGYFLSTEDLSPGLYTVLVRGTELSGSVKFTKIR